MPFDLDQLTRFPTDPGVYLMKDGKGIILYVGKAKNLRSRVKQYFQMGGDGRAIIPHLLSHLENIDTIIVASEKEALLLENTLIKKHQPKYNALLKDDKTFFSLAVNYKHLWPMVRVVRYKGKPPTDSLYFGPYTNGRAAKQTLEIMHHIFPLRQCSDRELVNRTRPCILYDLKQCIAPCVAKCTKEEYDALVQRTIHFLKGQDDLVLKELEKEMEKASENLEFEKAQALYQAIRSIKATLEEQHVQKVGTGKIDVIGLFRQADTVIVTQMFYREGKLIGSHDHSFTSILENDDELMTSFLLQHYGENQFPPHEIILPFDFPEKESVSSLLSENAKKRVELLVPKRGDKMDLIKIACKNAEARFHRELETKNKKEQLLISLEETFHLTNYPERIECFDNSNIAGTEQVSALVVFTSGQKDPKAYRKYKIRLAAEGDDYGALEEVLRRRYGRAKEENHLPDLLLIDGGKGHLNVALRVFKELDISTVDLIAVAKEEGKHTKGMTQERAFLPHQDEPIQLHAHSSLLHFLQQIRDEAHRFAISFQRDRRGKKSLSSVFDELPGFGQVKKQRLLRHFGSWKRILEATDEEILSVQGINRKDLETLKARKKDKFQKKEEPETPSHE